MRMRLITVAAIATLLGDQAHAHPALASSKRNVQGRAVDFNSFRLGTKSIYRNATYIAGSSAASSFSKRESYVDTAKALVEKVAPNSEFRMVDDHYVGSNGIAHVNFKQTVHGLDIDNADFNVNVRPPRMLMV